MLNHWSFCKKKTDLQTGAYVPLSLYNGTVVGVVVKRTIQCVVNKI